MVAVEVPSTGNQTHLPTWGLADWPLPPAGTLVLTGSIDASCRLWDVCSGRCLSVKQGHTGGGRAAAPRVHHTCRCGLLCKLHPELPGAGSLHTFGLPPLHRVMLA
jgi:hypothetical protein